MQIKIKTITNKVSSYGKYKIEGEFTEGELLALINALQAYSDTGFSLVCTDVYLAFARAMDIKDGKRCKYGAEGCDCKITKGPHV